MDFSSLDKHIVDFILQAWPDKFVARKNFWHGTSRYDVHDFSLGEREYLRLKTGFSIFEKNPKRFVRLEWIQENAIGWYKKDERIELGAEQEKRLTSKITMHFDILKNRLLKTQEEQKNSIKYELVRTIMGGLL